MQVEVGVGGYRCVRERERRQGMTEDTAVCPLILLYNCMIPRRFSSRVDSVTSL